MRSEVALSTTFKSGRFRIEFPGPVLRIEVGGTMGLTIHELRELGDLIATALEYAGAKRERLSYADGDPAQIYRNTNERPTLS